MRWQERFLIKKIGVDSDYTPVLITFGMFGLYSHLGVYFEGSKAARNAQRLDRGEHIELGGYDVFKDCCYYSENNY